MQAAREAGAVPSSPFFKPESAMPKTVRRDSAALEDLPNVGPAMAADFRRMGIHAPQDLRGRDPFALYDELNRSSGVRHDPCVLDTFIAVVRFVAGGPARPWWKYTAERKRALAAAGKPVVAAARKAPVRRRAGTASRTAAAK
jgi:hypothetical protein